MIAKLHQAGCFASQLEQLLLCARCHDTIADYRDSSDVGTIHGDYILANEEDIGYLAGRLRRRITSRQTEQEKPYQTIPCTLYSQHDSLSWLFFLRISD
jgi:hypothetical protein